MIPKARKLPSGSYNIQLMLNGQRISITAPTQEACLTRYYALKFREDGKAQQIEIRSALIHQQNARYRQKKITVRDVKTASSISKTFPKSYNEELKSIDKMDGMDFEAYCSSLLYLTGLFPGSKFTVTKKTNDYGADILISHPNGEKTVIQCKRLETNVSIDAVQEVYAAKAHYRATNCGVITNREFTPQAVVLAADTGVILFDRQALATLMQLERDNLKRIMSSQWKSLTSMVFSQDSDNEYSEQE